MTETSTPADELREVLSGAHARLAERDDTWSATPSAPGKWTPREIIGHLIDSASNNHQRFVRARFRDDLVFDGYDQDAWVAAQGYSDASWSDLLELWVGFNLHLARVIELTPQSVLRMPRAVHSLDRIAWQRVPAEDPVTLEYFMRDYVGHLMHHLRALDPELCPSPRLQRR